MAVVPRKRKSKVVYYAVNEWGGRQVAELVGPSRRDAEVRDRAMKREIKAGEYQPQAGRKAMSLAEYAAFWLKPRTNASAKDERALFRLYISPREWLANKRLEDVRPADALLLVDELRSEKKAGGERRLSDKTIANCVGLLRQIFARAEIEERVARNPIRLQKNTLRRRPHREREVYSVKEVKALIKSHRIPWPIRVLNALCLLAGLREGEACGRRWRDLDLGTTPLASLSVHDQYDGKPLKTDRPRIVPVHPELRRVLLEWRDEGFETYVCQKPTPDDFIVPSTSSRAAKPDSCYSRSSYYKYFNRTAEAAGVETRSLHATRHTFITMCRRGGARAEVLERVTHNATGSMIDRYTHFDFAPLCEAVSCLSLDAHPNSQPNSESGGNSGPSDSGAGSNNPRDSSESASEAQGSIPGASTRKELENKGARKTRQAARQESDGILEELREANRGRKRRLLSLAGADPAAAGPGLAICRAYDAILDGDVEQALDHLSTADTGRPNRRGKKARVA